MSLGYYSTPGRNIVHKHAVVTLTEHMRLEVALREGKQMKVGFNAAKDATPSTHFTHAQAKPRCHSLALIKLYDGIYIHSAAV